MKNLAQKKHFKSQKRASLNNINELVCRKKGKLTKFRQAARLSLVPAGGVLVDCGVVLLASVRPDRSKAQSLKKSWSVLYNFRVGNRIVVYNIVPMV